MNTQFESTYAMIVRSEDRRRNALEIVVYFACVLVSLAGILQFAHTPVNVTAPGFQPPLVTSSIVTSAVEQS